MGNIGYEAFTFQGKDLILYFFLKIAGFNSTSLLLAAKVELKRQNISDHTISQGSKKAN